MFEDKNTRNIFDIHVGLWYTYNLRCNTLHMQAPPIILKSSLLKAHNHHGLEEVCMGEESVDI